MAISGVRIHGTIHPSATDDIPKFRLKIRIAGKLKDTRQVWLDFVLTPDSLHGRLGDTKLASHRAASPSYPALRWPGGLIDNPAQQFGADVAFAARAGLVLQRPNPPLEIAPSPLRDLVIVQADAPSDHPDPNTLSR